MSPQIKSTLEDVWRVVTSGGWIVALFFLVRIVNQVDRMDEKLTAALVEQASTKTEVAILKIYVRDLQRKTNTD